MNSAAAQAASTSMSADPVTTRGILNFLRSVGVVGEPVVSRRPELPDRFYSRETLLLLYPSMASRLDEVRSRSEMRDGQRVIVYSVMDVYNLWAQAKIARSQPTKRKNPADYDIQTDTLPAFIDYAGKRYFNMRQTMAATGYSESRIKAIRDYVDTIERTWQHARSGCRVIFYEVESVLAYKAAHRGKKRKKCDAVRANATTSR